MGEATTLRCGVVSQKGRPTADFTLRHFNGNFHDALCGVVEFYDATPQRSVVTSPYNFNLYGGLKKIHKKYGNLFIA